MDRELAIAADFGRIYGHPTAVEIGLLEDNILIGVSSGDLTGYLETGRASASDTEEESSKNG